MRCRLCGLQRVIVVCRYSLKILTDGKVFRFSTRLLERYSNAMVHCGALWRVDGMTLSTPGEKCDLPLIQWWTRRNPNNTVYCCTSHNIFMEAARGSALAATRLIWTNDWGSLPLLYEQNCSTCQWGDIFPQVKVPSKDKTLCILRRAENSRQTNAGPQTDVPSICVIVVHFRANYTLRETSELHEEKTIGLQWAVIPAVFMLAITLFCLVRVTKPEIAQAALTRLLKNVDPRPPKGFPAPKTSMRHESKENAGLTWWLDTSRAVSWCIGTSGPIGMLPKWTSLTDFKHQTIQLFLAATLSDTFKMSPAGLGKSSTLYGVVPYPRSSRG